MKQTSKMNNVKNAYFLQFSFHFFSSIFFISCYFHQICSFSFDGFLSIPFCSRHSLTLFTNKTLSISLSSSFSIHFFYFCFTFRYISSGISLILQRDTHCISQYPLLIWFGFSSFLFSLLFFSCKQKRTVIN